MLFVLICSAPPEALEKKAERFDPKGRRLYVAPDPDSRETAAALFGKDLPSLPLPASLAEAEEAGTDAILIAPAETLKLLLREARKRRYHVERGSVWFIRPLDRIRLTKDLPRCGNCSHNCLLAEAKCLIGQEKAQRLP